MAYKREHVKERFRPKPGRLLDQVREVMRYHHYAIRTEQTYIKWMLDYIRFNGTRHPREMGKPEIERFLSHLAVNRNVASSTQNQALNAILFLYKHVLDMPLNGYIDATRSKKRKRLPTVLNQSEISRFFGILHKTPKVVYTFRVLAKILIFFMTCRTPENKALQGAQKNCWEFGLSRKV